MNTPWREEVMPDNLWGPKPTRALINNKNITAKYDREMVQLDFNLRVFLWEPIIVSFSNSLSLGWKRGYEPDTNVATDTDVSVLHNIYCIERLQRCTEIKMPLMLYILLVL